MHLVGFFVEICYGACVKYVTVRASNMRQLCETLKILPFILNNFPLVYINVFGKMNFLEITNDCDEPALKHFFFSHDYLSVTEWRSRSINIILVCSSTVVASDSIYELR